MQYALIIQALIQVIGKYSNIAISILKCGHHDIGLPPSNRSIHLRYTSSILTLALTHIGARILIPGPAHSVQSWCGQLLNISMGVAPCKVRAG